MLSLYDMIDNDEIVYGTYRTHAIFLIGQLLSEIVLLALTFLAMSLSNQLLGSYENQETPALIITLILSVVALVLIISATIDVLRWYTKVIIVTDRRLIRREGFVQRHIIDITLHRLSQVDFAQSLIGRLMNYGNMTISGGADLPPQEIRNIGNPVKLRNTIEDARVGVPPADYVPPAPVQVPVHAPVDRETSPVVMPVVDAPHELSVWEQFEDLHHRGFLTDDELEAKRRMIFGDPTETMNNQNSDGNDDDNDDGTSTRAGHARGGDYS